MKAKEQENLEAKTAICEQIENIDFPALKSFKDWEEKNKEVIALQDKWKTIGFAPKKSNVKIFERFRAACDVYFNRKSEFYKNIKDEMEKNLALKKALCEKAEALKDSTDLEEHNRKDVQISCRDALKVIKNRDSPETFFYLDPPYPGAVQGHYYGYSEKNLADLLTILVKLKGRFILSNYWTETLRTAVDENRWNFIRFHILDAADRYTLNICNGPKGNGIFFIADLLINA